MSKGFFRKNFILQIRRKTPDLFDLVGFWAKPYTYTRRMFDDGDEGMAKQLVVNFDLQEEVCVVG